MPKSYGGQMRTTQCPHCDWVCRKQLQEANKAYQRHLRLVHQEKAEMTPFNDVNGRDGMTTTRHGGIICLPLQQTRQQIYKDGIKIV